MLFDNYKKGFLQIQNVYFASDIVKSTADITKYSQCKKSNDKYIEFNTNILDLTLNFEEIEQGFRKNIRNEIRQANIKYQIQTELFYKPRSELINNFCLFYDNVAQEKKIPNSDRDQLERLKKNVLISKAFNDEDVLVWHLYIFDKERVRLLYSCSLQTYDKDLYKEISKANKLLHSKDIKFAKGKGYRILDFGGLSFIDEKIAGIDAFKLGFSKHVEKSYNFLVANTLLGKAALFLYNLKLKRKKNR